MGVLSAGTESMRLSPWGAWTEVFFFSSLKTWRAFPRVEEHSLYTNGLADGMERFVQASEGEFLWHDGLVFPLFLPLLSRISGIFGVNTIGKGEHGFRCAKIAAAGS